MKKQYVKPESQIITLGVSPFMASTYEDGITFSDGTINNGAPIYGSVEVNEDSGNNTDDSGVAGKDGLVYDETWGVWDEE